MHIFLMTFLVLFFKKKKLEKKKKGIQNWLGVGWGDREGDIWLEFKLRTLVSFSEDLENIKGAGVSFFYTLRLSYIRKLLGLRPNAPKLLY